MPEPYQLRRARPEEAPKVLDLLENVVTWLHERGSDQWSARQHWPRKMAPAFAAGEVWLLLDGDILAGTVTLGSRPDPDFWSVEERTAPAVYLSKMVVHRAYSGGGLGDLLLAWAGDRAHRDGVPLLRLDAWRTNVALHRYYLDRGWRQVRTMSVPGRGSGALFEIDAVPMPAELRDRIREVDR